MQITINLPISAEDAAILASLIEGVAPATEAPAPKAAPAAKKTAPKPEPEPKAEVSPLEEAVAKATALVGVGKHALVKKALAEVSVARVSQLGEGDVEAFMAVLDEG